MFRQHQNGDAMQRKPTEQSLVTAIQRELDIALTRLADAPSIAGGDDDSDELVTCPDAAIDAVLESFETLDDAAVLQLLRDFNRTAMQSRE
jgi:hypothetical protein